MAARITYRFVAKAAPAEAEKIITLYKAHGWWTRGDGPAALNRLIRGSHCFVVAQRSGAIIGMARAISDRAGDAYIQDVAVLPGHRGDGAGKGLVAAVCRRLKRDGIAWVALIAQDNSEKFYRKLGFTTLRLAAPMLIKGARV